MRLATTRGALWVRRAAPGVSRALGAARAGPRDRGSWPTCHAEPRCPSTHPVPTPDLLPGAGHPRRTTRPWICPVWPMAAPPTRSATARQSRSRWCAPCPAHPAPCAALTPPPRPPPPPPPPPPSILTSLHLHIQLPLPHLHPPLPLINYKKCQFFRWSDMKN